MEQELGRKLTRVADEFSSNFQISKDRAGPLFLSRETEAMFILTAHLNGYKRGNIKIDINEDGTLITVTGERQVKETVMAGWKVYKKDTETKAFTKAFKIPATVNLDKIKAKYNDEESTLTITMPKKVKGIQGVAVEEVKEVAELAREGSGNLQIWDEKVRKNEKSDQEDDEMTKSRQQEDSGENEVTQEEMPKKGTESVLESGGDRVQDEVHENGYHGKELTEETKSSPSKKSKVPRLETETPKQALVNENTEDDAPEKLETQLVHAESLGIMPVKNEAQNENDQILDKESERHTPEVEVQEAAAEAGRGEEGEPKQRSKRCKMCTPIVAAGSAILLSFVVFVIHIIRSKNQTSKRKD